MEQIPLPLDHLYDSYEEAYSSLKAHGIQHGYGFVLKRSKPHNSDVKTRYYYHCDRFRNFQSSAKRLNRSTRSTGCPFRLVIFKMKHNNQWKLEVQGMHHNHSRSTTSSTHNVYRRRTQAQKDMIESMTHAGSRPMQILAAIRREDPNTLISAADIRSERKKIREKHLNEECLKKALVDDLSKGDCVFAVEEATVSTATSGPNADPVERRISVSSPAHDSLPPPISLRSSPHMAVTISAAMATSPIWQPPSLEEFLADIESRKFQPVLYHNNDMISRTNFLAETEQQCDPAELIEARNMALATQGLFESCTPTMAWNYHFGDMEAFYAERFAQVDAQNAAVVSGTISF